MIRFAFAVRWNWRIEKTTRPRAGLVLYGVGERRGVAADLLLSSSVVRECRVARKSPSPLRGERLR
jgi:hypothetical protein